jgi:hypothetical protein
MKTFVHKFIAPLLRDRGWKSICEIGASAGETTDELLKEPLAHYTVIDPCFDEDLEAKYADDSRVTVVKRNSLDALAAGVEGLPGAPFDCILIDGDHNWYTVFNELRLIRERGALAPGGYLFFHDVGWPYGRRDMYYQPETIPAEFRRPFARKGMVRGQSKLAEDGGICEQFCNALDEGGARNGVLTAIEDFVALSPGEYRFARVQFEFGLGIMQFRPKDAGLDLSFLRVQTKAAVYNLFANRALAAKRALKRLSAS